MMTYPQKERYDINDLIEVIRMLRLPDGCPWDKVQTHESIRMNFIEEVYEVIEAIDKNDTALMREELGDVLMQVVFHAQMEREQGNFDFDDVCDEVCRKLIIRHPHVFSNVQAGNTDEAVNSWEQVKQQTKGQTTYTETLESVILQIRRIPLQSCSQKSWNCRMPFRQRMRMPLRKNWAICCFLARIWRERWMSMQKKP